MSNTSHTTHSTAIPCLMYRDASTAIGWLCRTVGFEHHAVYTNDDGSIAHAELTLAGGMIMLGSVNDGEYGRLVRQPDELGNAVSQSLYLVVDDPDVVYRRVKEAGGKIAIDIKDEDYGGRGFSFLDPEGHLWNIGSYDPWQPK